MKENVFGIQNFNIIEDDENYYFFRALNMADNSDIQEGITYSDGKIVSIRTDRQRFEQDETRLIAPKYNAESTISLEEVYDHIKMRYRKDTNCISLSSNANVSAVYGRGYYKDRYALVKVPKSEMEKSVVTAGSYMLKEIERQIEEAIAGTELDAKTKELLDRIDAATTNSELGQVLKTRYRTDEHVDVATLRTKRGIRYLPPDTRISSYQSLTAEQALEKNKVIAKLSALEKQGVIGSLIPGLESNRNLKRTIGNAFSSSELIHYGEIPQESIVELPKEIIDIFSLIQQCDDTDVRVQELKQKVLGYFLDKSSAPITLDNTYDRHYPQSNLAIDEAYELTGGKVEYASIKSAIDKTFYISKSRTLAEQYASVLEQIVGEDERYHDIIENIRTNTFYIEPSIITRKNGRGVKLSESVNIDVKPEEEKIVEDVKTLTREQREEIIVSGGRSDASRVLTDTFSRLKKDEQISIEDYYATAILDMYDWNAIGIENFTTSQRIEIIEKLKENDCVGLCRKLRAAGVDEQNLSTYVFNILSKKSLEKAKELSESDLEELIKASAEDLNESLTIDRVENFLGYYEIEGTSIVLRDYQKRAVERTDKIFKDKNFASVILPTGAGKTFVSITEMIEHGNENMLYLAPNDEILEQVKEYIVKYVHGKKDTLGKTTDEIVKEVFPNLTLDTYPGLLAYRGKAEIEKEYGLIVFDELHRTGAKEWSQKIDELIQNQGENTKVLGITATPERDVDGRNMADEMALKLGYAKEEIDDESHVAMNMDLITAIQLGIVVNPKLVTCEYSLGENHNLERLYERIKDGGTEEELRRYEELRRRVTEAQGVKEILNQNIKAGGKYIVFIPVADQSTNGEFENEDGNKLGTKSGKDKIAEYEEYLKEMFKDSGINPKFYSMLGEYGKKENLEQLDTFAADDSQEPKFMVVMNKANEGLHVPGVDGIVWLRPLDENSKILYLQQLGRAIYSEDPNNPTPDDKRPVVIDLANNTLRVRMDKEIRQHRTRDDYEMLNEITDWMEEHNGIMPDINSTSKMEARYGATLRRIQQDYLKYISGEEIDEQDEQKIRRILDKGESIDLWGLDLPQKAQTKITKEETLETFAIKGLLKDYSELEDMISVREDENAIKEFLRVCQALVDNGYELATKNLRKTLDGIRIYKTLGDIADEQGWDIDEVQRITGVDASYKYCSKLALLRKACEGTYKSGIEPEEIEQAIKLKLYVKEKESTNAEFLRVCQTLADNGYKIVTQNLSYELNDKTIYKTLGEIATESKMDIKDIEYKTGISADYKYGYKLKALRQSYNGNGSAVITEEEKKMAEELGLVQVGEKETAVTEFLRIAQILSNENIDISKIQQYKKNGRERKPITLRDVAIESKIDIEDIEAKTGMRADYKLGSKLATLRSAYNGTSKALITEEEKKMAEKLGLVQVGEKETAVAEFLRIAQVLSNEKINLSEINLRKDVNGEKKFKTLGDIAIESGIAIEDIEAETGVRADYKFGSKWNSLRQSYKGTGKALITEEERKVAEKLGLVQVGEKETAVAEFLRIAQILSSEKINLSKINLHKVVNRKTVFKTLGDIAIETEIDIEDIEAKTGMRADYKFGSKLATLRSAYKGIGGTPMTEEEKKMAEKLGLVILDEKGSVRRAMPSTTYEKSSVRRAMPSTTYEKSTVIADCLKVLEALHKSGLNFENMQLSEVVDGKQKTKCLRDVLDDVDLSVKKNIESTSISLDFEIGKRIEVIRRAYKGSTDYKITENEKKLAKQLGLIPEEKTFVSENLSKLKLLKDNGYEIVTQKLRYSLNRKTVYKTLGNIAEEHGWNIEEVERVTQLTREFPYGMRIKGLRQAYKGTTTLVITDEEKRLMEELGLVQPIIGQDLGKKSYDATVQECDEAQQALDDLVKTKQKTQTIQ